LDNFKRYVGKKIQERRVELGFSSQAKLARKLDVDQSDVSRWESGQNLPEGQHKQKLLEALDVDNSFIDIPKDFTARPQSIDEMTPEHIKEALKNAFSPKDTKLVKELIILARRLDNDSLQSLIDDAKDFIGSANVETPVNKSKGRT
jgi:transcriptional regulator with XRE-family HTH domain